MKDELRISKKDIKIRRSWPENFSPETKIEKPKTDYKRSKNKSEIQKALEQEELDNAGSDLDWLS
jgi:hypothetical protein